jgi:hypothetical protein
MNCNVYRLFVPFILILSFTQELSSLIFDSMSVISCSIPCDKCTSYFRIMFNAAKHLLSHQLRKQVIT